jgi:xanthosine utilization system XapX-like protein
MPWRVKRLLYLMALGFGVLALSIFVLVRHDSTDSDALAVIGILGGIAIILTNLPVNGKNHHDD